MHFRSSTWNRLRRDIHFFVVVVVVFVIFGLASLTEHSKCHVKRLPNASNVCSVCLQAECEAKSDFAQYNCHDFWAMRFSFSFPNGRADLHSTCYEFWFISPPVSLFLCSAPYQWCTYDRYSHDFSAYFDMVPARESTCMLWATWHELLHSRIYL